MISRSSCREGAIWAARLAAAMVIVLWPASGWAQSEIEMVFKPAAGEKVDARPAPAKVTSKQDSALISEGYFLIGTVSASQPGKKGDAAAMQHLESAMLKKAGEAGGDVVLFSKNGEPGTILM